MNLSERIYIKILWLKSWRKMQRLSCPFELKCVTPKRASQPHTSSFIVTLWNRCLNCALCVISIALHYLFIDFNIRFSFLLLQFFTLVQPANESVILKASIFLHISHVKFRCWRARAQTRAQNIPIEPRVSKCSFGCCYS